MTTFSSRMEQDAATGEWVVSLTVSTDLEMRRFPGDEAERALAFAHEIAGQPA